MNPHFFKTASDFREWFVTHYDKEKEVWIGIYKKNSEKKGISYEEAVEEGLCFGWIDGLTKRFDEISYMIRFTPRRPKSNWTATNIAKVERLKKEGRMHQSGIAAFERRIANI